MKNLKLKNLIFNQAIKPTKAANFFKNIKY